MNDNHKAPSPLRPDGRGGLAADIHDLSRFCVIVCSSKRPQVLADTLATIRLQTLRPLKIIISVASDEDLPRPSPETWDDVVVVKGTPGLTLQRNRGIDRLPSEIGWAAFVDDDVILHPDYCAQVARALQEHPSWSCVMGHLLANGGINAEAAAGLIASAADGSCANRSSVELTKAPGWLYGCNFAVRRQFLDIERFDEKLPLYSEMEDVDFGHRIIKFGPIGYCHAALAVHLRVPGGRINHHQQGFSQIINPVYLSGKGLLGRWSTLWAFAVKRPCANLWGLSRPSERTWRWQRLRGNMIAWSQIVRRRVDPRHLTDL